MWASTRRCSSAATRSTERRGWTFESNRSPAIRTRSTFSAMARSTVRPERGELPLTLGRGLIAEVVVTGTEMDVSCVDDPEHPLRLASSSVTCPARPSGGRCERGAPMTPRSLPRLSLGIVTGRLSRSPVPGARTHRDAGTTFLPVFATRCILPVITPVRPETGTPHRHLGARPRHLPARHARPDCLCGRP